MPNHNAKTSKIMFHFGAAPPALSIVTEDGDAYWFEIEDDLQLLSMRENLDVYLAKRFRILSARQEKK